MTYWRRERSILRSHRPSIWSYKVIRMCIKAQTHPNVSWLRIYMIRCRINVKESFLCVSLFVSFWFFDTQHVFFLKRDMKVNNYLSIIYNVYVLQAPLVVCLSALCVVSAPFHTCEGCKERARLSTNRGLNLLVHQGDLYLHFLCDNYSDSRAKKKKKKMWNVDPQMKSAAAPECDMKDVKLDGRMGGGGERVGGLAEEKIWKRKSSCSCSIMKDFCH